MRRRVLPAVLVMVLSASPAAATAPALFYLGQSLLYAAPGGAVGDLWLDPDGRYLLGIDGGPAAARTSSGAFRYRGRQGAYSITPAQTGVTLCLRPDTYGGPSASPPGALFEVPGCLALPVHPIGEVFTLIFAGQPYRLVLVQGR